MEKLIITVAPTGSIPKKKDTPHVPVTIEEIVSCALRCEDEGASIVHIHTRDEHENPSDDPRVFNEIVERVRERSNLIVQVSTGGRAGTDLKSRIQRLQMRPEMASLTTGSVNFPNSAYVNPPDLIEALAGEMRRLEIKPEMEVFDLSMVNNAAALADRDLAKRPLHFNFVMGLKGAMPAKIAHLVHLVTGLPAESTWTVSGIGAAQLKMAIHAVLMGGNVRVGLEDNIYYRKGELATNEKLVARISRLSKELGREVAEPDEARRILHLSPR
ncbi:MAG: 3-keto-5-aminohexanoate cleavage protein [Deltaproteobacteria bacterium]|jgi:3-keto-5-aminohexanoate cleavage enzyme|nr:3-keto-5-aminohexanoate cleavage protein [Deltaproteobacteria bacterium]